MSPKRTTAGRLAIGLMICFGRAALADRVFLNNGEEYVGDIVSYAGGKLVVTKDGKEREVKGEEIHSLAFAHPLDGGKSARKVSEIMDPELAALLKAAPLDPEAPSEVLLQEKVLTLHPDGSSETRERYVARILKEKGMGEANLEFSYLPIYGPARVLLARTLLPEEDRISYADTYTLKEGKVYPNYPRYNFLKRITGLIPDAVPGAVVEYELASEVRKHDIFYPFWDRISFRGASPLHLARLVVKVPRGTPLRYREVRLPEGVKRTKSEEGEYEVYRWEARQVAPYYQENNTPPAWRYLPYVVFVVGPSWEELVSSYRKEAEEKGAGGDDLTRKAAALTKGIASDEEKAAKLYSFVAKEVKTVKVAPDAVAYRLNPVAEVLKEGAANPFDKNLLYVSLLQAAGLKAEWLLCRTENLEEPDPALPCLYQFDAAAVAVEVAGGKKFFAQPDKATYAFGLLPAALEGGSCLSLATAAIGPVPRLTPEENGLVEVATGLLDEEGNLKVEARLVFRGYEAAGIKEWRYFQDLEVEKKVQEMVAGLDSKSELASYRFEGLAGEGREVSCRVEYRIPSFGHTAGPLMLVRVPGKPEDASSVALPRRELPVFWYSGEDTSQEFTFTLPPGYRVYSLPPEFQREYRGIVYRASYEEKEGKVVFREAKDRAVQEIAAADYPGYKQGVEETVKYSRAWLVLEKK